jgi:hypothetical protein
MSDVSANGSEFPIDTGLSIVMWIHKIVDRSDARIVVISVTYGYQGMGRAATAALFNQS